MGLQRASQDYATRYRTALLLALDEGAPSFEIARSRAALMTWKSASGVPFAEAEATRVRVAAEEATALGVEPLRAGVVPGAVVAPGGDLTTAKIPHRRAVTGEKPRRSGQR